MEEEKGKMRDAKETEDATQEVATREFHDHQESRKRFDFGQHRGRTFGDVHDSEQDHCEWAMKQEPTTQVLREFQKYVERREAGASSESKTGNFEKLMDRRRKDKSQKRVDRQRLERVYTDTSHTSFFTCTLHLIILCISHITAQDEPRLKCLHSSITPYSYHP